MIIGPLHITLSKTSDGKNEYLQILSSDMTVNIVLIAEKFDVQDSRPSGKRQSK